MSRRKCCCCACVGLTPSNTQPDLSLTAVGGPLCAPADGDYDWSGVVSGEYIWTNYTLYQYVHVGVSCNSETNSWVVHVARYPMGLTYDSGSATACLTLNGSGEFKGEAVVQTYWYPPVGDPIPLCLVTVTFNGT